MAKQLYFDRKGDSLSFKAWSELHKKPTYHIVRQFSNGKLKAVVNWIGHDPHCLDTFLEFWKMFVVTVHNIVQDQHGMTHEVIDPNLTQYFPTEAKAIEHYENLLTLWSECTIKVKRNDDGTTVRELVENGNILEPPVDPQPEQDIPIAVKEATNPDAGSW